LRIQIWLDISGGSTMAPPRERADMPDARISNQENDEIITLRLEGTFDGAAALKLRSRLEALGLKRVVIDFSRVRTFRDAAIGVLARDLANPLLELRGLDTHQERVFRYLGVGSAPEQRPAFELDA
jgi:hypothetical protein